MQIRCAPHAPQQDFECNSWQLWHRIYGISSSLSTSFTTGGIWLCVLYATKHLCLNNQNNFLSINPYVVHHYSSDSQFPGAVDFIWIFSLIPSVLNEFITVICHFLHHYGFYLLFILIADSVSQKYSCQQTLVCHFHFEDTVYLWRFFEMALLHAKISVWFLLFDFRHLKCD